MHDDRHVQVDGKLQLLLKDAQLVGLGNVPVIVQPRLADRDDLRMLGQFGDLQEVVTGQVFKVLGMDADSGINKVILLRERDHALCVLQIDGVVDNAADALFGQRRKQRVPVRVEPSVVIVSM